MAAPIEGHETRLGDAILAELRKIQRDGGSALWKGARPAVVDRLLLGMPPHNDVPGIYLHLADWQEREDIFGADRRRALATYDVVLVAASLPDPSRALQRMARDVRDVLAAGEETIEAALGSETERGTSVVFSGVGYTFQRELSERYGLAIGTYTFRVDYIWIEDEMTDAQVRALIHEMLMSPAYQRFELDRAVGAQGGTNAPGIRTAGFTEKPWGLAHYLTSPGGGVANRTVEICKDWLVNPLEYEGIGVFNQRCTFAMLINLVSMGGAAPAGECFQGIEIGSMGVAPPYQTNYVSSFGGPCIQFRYNLGRSTGAAPAWSDGYWELMIHADDGQAPLVLDADIRPVTVADKPKELKLEYIPSPNGGSVVRAYLNGQLAKEYSGARLQACYGRTNTKHVGYFITSGSNAATSLTEAGFLESRIWLPDSYAYPSPAN